METTTTTTTTTTTATMLMTAAEAESGDPETDGKIADRGDSSGQSKSGSGNSSKGGRILSDENRVGSQGEEAESLRAKTKEVEDKIKQEIVFS